ncbi:unnamed protein product [Protopolystoma xenopodis]|uniref:Uncharacterized protein n=1 Tax=Protopolystoma xenopodis TaxID=117903 RepID=A0A448XNL6_9PLAT|nr:unnamed protein product [Protopolystoma xenopodis]
MASAPTWRVRLDPCQYQADLERSRHWQSEAKRARQLADRARREGRPPEEVADWQGKAAAADARAKGPEAEDVYDTFNVLVRPLIFHINADVLTQQNQDFLFILTVGVPLISFEKTNAVIIGSYRRNSDCRFVPMNPRLTDLGPQ